MSDTKIMSAEELAHTILLERANIMRDFAEQGFIVVHAKLLEAARRREQLHLDSHDAQARRISELEYYEKAHARLKEEDQKRADQIRDLVPRHMHLWPPLDAVREVCKERLILFDQKLELIKQRDDAVREIQRLQGLLDEALKEKERLDWLIEKEAYVLKETGDGRWFVSFYDAEPQDGYYPSARAAIDAAKEPAK